MHLTQKHPKIFYGWYIVAAGLLIQLYTIGFVQFGFTAVFEPVVAEFGWSHAQVSFAASLRGFEIGLLAPVVGFLVDRWGPRKLIFLGGIILAVGCLLLSRVSSLFMFYIAFALLSIGMSTTTHTVVVTSVGHWFHKNIGVAIGIAASGVGLGGLMVPVVTRMIDALQWRTAMIVAGVGMLVIVLPLSLVLRHKPEDYGYLPDGLAADNEMTNSVNVSTRNVEVDVPYKKALRTSAFWHVAIATTCLTFMISSITTHIMPYFSTIGVARSASSLVALALPVVSIGGRLGSGWLSGRFGTKKVFVTGFTLMTIGTLMLACLASSRMGLLAPFIVALSLGWGTIVTTRMAMQREYFGRGHFGTILGLASGVMMIGSMFGAPVVGWIFDTLGSYQYAWFLCSALGCIGIILAVTTPDPRNHK